MSKTCFSEIKRENYFKMSFSFFFFFFFFFFLLLLLLLLLFWGGVSCFFVCLFVCFCCFFFCLFVCLLFFFVLSVSVRTAHAQPALDITAN